jgi:hypothetical protein
MIDEHTLLLHRWTPQNGKSTRRAVGHRHQLENVVKVAQQFVITQLAQCVLDRTWLFSFRILTDHHDEPFCPTVAKEM